MVWGVVNSVHVHVLARDAVSAVRSRSQRLLRVGACRRRRRARRRRRREPRRHRRVVARLGLQTRAAVAALDPHAVLHREVVRPQRVIASFSSTGATPLKKSQDWPTSESCGLFLMPASRPPHPCRRTAAAQVPRASTSMLPRAALGLRGKNRGCASPSLVLISAASKVGGCVGAPRFKQRRALRMQLSPSFDSRSLARLRGV